LLLKEAEQRLSADPLAETQNLKTLQPNPLARRELRLFGNYRVLFNVEVDAQEVVIVLVGEKRGDSLIVQGKEFTHHHEGHTAK
jgi:hypothetical protein